MSSSHPYSRFLAILVFFFCVCGFGQEPFSVRFKVESSMIIVPVTINGSGPYNFIFDTGNSDITVDSKLAAELRLPNAGDAKIMAATEGAAVAAVVHIDSVLMGGARVENINASVMKRFEGSFGTVRGLLGEGFLRKFDLLIDNRHHIIEFESGPGPLIDTLTGERTLFLTHGEYQGRSTLRRIVVFARVRDLGDRDLRLLLDSGADRVVLFAKLDSLNVKEKNYSISNTMSSDNVTTVDELRVNSLSVGGSILPSLTVTAPSILPPSDVDGLLPTSLFHSVFISHSGEFVILNPASKPEMAQLPAKL